MTEPAEPPAPVPLARRALEGGLLAAPTGGVLALGALTGEPWLREAIQGLLQQGPTVALALLVLGVLYSHHRSELAEARADHALTRARLDRIQDALIAPDLHRSTEGGPP